MIQIIKPDEVREKHAIKKAWGAELIIHNSDSYCGKLLIFEQGAKFSMHFHHIKKETWYVSEGNFKLKYIDTKDATEHEVELESGTIIEIDRCSPHQLSTETGGIIFEVSTPHYDDDSYRIAKGDSQLKKEE